MSLNPTPGAPDADAYISVDEATEYFTKYSPDKADLWESFSEEAQEPAIRKATKMLDYDVVWKGSPKDTSTPQALQHPRVGLHDRMGLVFPDTEILPDLKAATAELALLIVSGNMPDTEAIGDFAPFAKMTIGPSLSFDIDTSKGSPPKVPQTIMELISPWAVRFVDRSESKLIRV